MYKGVWYNKKILDAGERVNMIKWKILKITENTIYIGYEDGSLKEIPIKSCEFEPRMGDYVEVYGDIAIKVEGSNESTPVKKHKSRKSKIKLILTALVVIVLSVSAYFIMNKVTILQNTSSSSSFSYLSSSSNSKSLQWVIAGILSILYITWISFRHFQITNGFLI